MIPINLKELKQGDSVSGLILIQSYTKKSENSNSKAPLYGECYYLGKTMKFKIWEQGLQQIFNTNDLEGSIIHITGDVGIYQEKMELTVRTLNFDHGFNDQTVFYKTVDVDSVFNSFVGFVNENLSQEAIALLTDLFSTEQLFEPFKLTPAGIRMHDAQIGGLMNHTLKMLRLAKTLIENDERLKSYSDLLYFGIILHDIGKVNELELFSYRVNSFITHRALGVEVVVRNKEKIVSVFGETFYTHMIAIQLGHHGEYADKPTTIWAYIIHLIDMLESQVTGFLDRMENSEYTIRNGHKTVWVNGDHLTV